jgi:polysaccharide export outer membrane protein
MLHRSNTYTQSATRATHESVQTRQKPLHLQTTHRVNVLYTQHRELRSGDGAFGNDIIVNGLWRVSLYWNETGTRCQYDVGSMERACILRRMQYFRPIQPETRLPGRGLVETQAVPGGGDSMKWRDERMKQARSSMVARRRSFWTSILIAGAVAGVSLVGPRAGAQTAAPDYKIHPGDKLVVGVYDDPKLLPQEMTVSPDGKISYPLVGVMMAGGRTVDQIRVEMEAKLKKYISDPIATVIVTDTKGNAVYVIGQVLKPGQLIMNPTINVLQALSMAGGANPYAKLDSIIVIRSTPGGQRVLPFKYGQVSSGKELSQNVDLESGDVVVVP